MSLWAVFVTGLFAGGASCAAVQGGLLAGTMARRRPHTAPIWARRPNVRRAFEDAPSSSALVEDAAPVAGFLAGKLASHALVGAALGLLGDAVELGPRVRASLQIVAGLAMLLLAFDLLGLAAVRGVVPAPPAAWAGLVRRSGRWGNGLAPALLGVATVLIPCGVTLSMMFLAVASGSPLAGAAIMATFVVGTMPLFTAIGYAARRSTAVLRGRLGALAGAAVLVAGLLSINAGLVLNGSSFTLAGVWRDVAGGDPPTAVAAPPVDADGVQRIVILTRSTSYSPAAVTARAGVPTKLTFRTDNASGCTRAVVLRSFGIQKVLPATGDTTIDVGILQPGTYRYTCGMGMYSGSITAVAS